MARIQALPLPDGSYVLMIDEAYTFSDDEFAALAQSADSIKAATGARGLLVFSTSMDVA